METHQLNTNMSLWTANDCAYAYRAGVATPMDVVRHCLEMADHSQSVFTCVTHEIALQQASAATDRLRKKQTLGVLDGVPFAWKDLFDVEGTVTTAGSVFFKDVAKSDAELVKAARQAGMVTIGKTNLSEFAYSGLGINPHYGTPTHWLWPGKYAPGGSSSGSGIAVANHIVPLAVGTDTGGSVRIPAAFNGVVGYRASRNRYSKIGMLPLADSLDTIGPIARSVQDCWLFDRAISGLPEMSSSFARPDLVVPKELIESAAIDDDVKTRFHDTLDVLKRAGYVVRVRPVPAIAQVMSLLAEQGWLGAPEAYATHRERLHGPDAGLFDPRVRQRLLSTGDMPAWQYISLQFRRRVLIDMLRHDLDGHLLTSPTVSHVAPELAFLLDDDAYFSKKNIETLHLTMIGSFLDMPAIAMPSGQNSDGRFCGIQFAMSVGQDEELLSACREIENTCCVQQTH